MDYEKKYKEAIEKLRNFYRDYDTVSCIIDVKEELANLFPELKESEDERIMKAIHIYLDWLDGRKDYAPRGEYTIRDMIAWLEKQGESTDINPSEFDLRLNKLLKQFETLSKEELASSLSFYLNVVQNDGTYKADEKQGVQKPANKVESKFHEGDWVVQENIGTYKVVEVCESWYEVIDIENNHYSISFDKEYMCHLWTIQDAKDGDVLCCESGWTCIFKALDNHTNTFSSYCFMDKDKWFCNTGSECHTLDERFVKAYNGEISPATKEQRDLLFQKMKEAGYEWDSEKKKLKKIELTKSESEEELSDFEAALFSAFSDGWQQYLHGEEVDFAQWAKEHSAELLEAANQNHVAWSEEDEEFLRRAIKATKDVYPVTANWLKSLKDRIQPKQEWSEEDSYMLESIVSDFAAGHKSSIGQDKWLKSLKPQNHWKPTKDQMEALHDLNLTGNISYAGQGQVLIELYNDLKTLKEY